MGTQRLFALLAAASVATACGGERYRPLRPGDPAPAFEARTLDGALFEIGGTNDQAMLVNVWATWCIPCREEMPALQALHERFGDDGLRVVGVNIDTGGDERVRAFLDDFGITYLNVRDPTDRITSAYRLVGVPETVLIGRDGRIARRWIGRFDPLNGDVLEAVRNAIGRGP